VLKVIQAIPGMPAKVTEIEVEGFLQSKLNMQLATLEPDGFPIIQPVWFHYEAAQNKLYTGTQKDSRKIRNIRKNPDKIYFSIDDENFPYKGVKGRGKARILDDIGRNVVLIEKINLKYLGTQEHPLAKRLIDNAKNGVEVVIEISPEFYSAWDFAKAA
jgi:nitroimidazol reductase NimA-like FMN-containing flavoprotein (pyridoxamine 5'-phosphate oxidase superfamily)